MRYKKPFTDALYNLIASFLPIALLQLVVLPYVAQNLTADDYGLVVSALALISVCSFTIGYVLNNIRLLKNREYQRAQIEGDFLPLIGIGTAINIVVMSVGTVIIGSPSIVETVFIVLASCAVLIKEYAVVQFNSALDYRRILITNVFQSLGLIVGAVLFAFTGFWSLIYLVAYLFALAYLMKSGTILKEPFRITPRFKKTASDAVELTVALLLNRITTYADRLILLPFAGGAAVATYFVASLFGKILAMLVSPINTVVLSYLANMEENSRKHFYVSLVSGAVLCILGFVVTLVIAVPVIGVLYPDYVDAATPYIGIATAAAYILTLGSIINPFVLRYCNLKWQTILNFIHAVIFLGAASVGYIAFGLMGFCAGMVIANSVRLILLVLVYAVLSSR